MKVLVIGKFYTEGFAQHIAESLTASGHDVVRFEPGVRRINRPGIFWKRIEQVKFVSWDALHRVSPMFVRWQQRRLQTVAQQAKPYLTIVTHDFLTPSDVEVVRLATGSPVVLWFPDSISVFGKSCFLNAPYDALFFKDPYMVNVLRRMLKTPVYYLPECCATSHAFQGDSAATFPGDYTCDVTTAGNLYPYRVAVFSQLTSYDVRIWGNPPSTWMNTGPIRQMIQNRFVADQEKVHAFRSAKIVLNSLHPAEIWGINVRAFEIAAAGAFQLIDARPGLNQLFEDGKELVSFENMDDLRQKIEFYLQQPELRQEIAYRGYKRAVAEHTYEKRLELLIETVRGNKEGYPTPDIAMSAGSPERSTHGIENAAA